MIFSPAIPFSFMRSLTLLFVFCPLVLTTFGQSSKAKPITSKPKTSAAAKPSATPPKRPAGKQPDEKSAWEKASKIEDPAARVEALKKFNAAFPKSARLNDSLSLMVTSRNDIANTRLAAGDVAGAAAVLKDAAADAPKPIPDALWTEVLSKVPAKLYFKGARGEAYDVAEVLEEKTEGNAAQTLALASFYLTVEDGVPAQRLAERVIAADANSSLAYQTIGLAKRVDLKVEESEASFIKAVELDPESLSAKRSLAEAKRSLGKADEAIALYREILSKEEGNIPAQTGLVLALFDAGKRVEAEEQMTKALASNSSNVILPGSAAYWYATQGEGEKAVEYAQKAITADPRFIWSHIALARGYLLMHQPAEAEKTLFMAQRYGNFPTMNYEIAAARYAAGYYNDAADALAESFVIKDGTVKVMVAGRVEREGKDLSEAIGYERKASIFAPIAADDPDVVAHLAALLELRQSLVSADPAASSSLGGVIDRFTAGGDKLRIYRQLYAARLLLERKLDLAKVLQLTREASANVDAGTEGPGVASAVFASEVRELRAAARGRGEYLNVPPVPKNMVSAILRGEIEAISGWASFQMENANEAVVRLRRAVNILPVDSSWWRTSSWRLGSALAAAGKDAEALENYIKAYKSAGLTDPVRYSMIEAVYKRVNGSTDGLETKIGRNPAPSVAELPKAVEPAASPGPTPTPSPTPSPGGVEILPAPVPETPKPCSLRASENEPVLSATGGDLSIMIDTADEIVLDDLTAVSSSPDDLSVRREIIAGVKTRAIFVMRSVSGKTGTYTLVLQMPCGKKELSVSVR